MLDQSVNLPRDIRPIAVKIIEAVGIGGGAGGSGGDDN